MNGDADKTQETPAPWESRREPRRGPVSVPALAMAVQAMAQLSREQLEQRLVEWERDLVDRAAAAYCRVLLSGDSRVVGDLLLEGLNAAGRRGPVDEPELVGESSMDEVYAVYCRAYAAGRLGPEWSRPKDGDGSTLEGRAAAALGLHDGANAQPPSTLPRLMESVAAALAGAGEADLAGARLAEAWARLAHARAALRGRR